MPLAPLEREEVLDGADRNGILERQPVFLLPLAHQGGHRRLTELDSTADRTIEPVVADAVVAALDEDPIAGTTQRDGQRSNLISCVRSALAHT